MGPVDSVKTAVLDGSGDRCDYRFHSPVRDRSLHGKEVSPIMMSQLLAVIASFRKDEGQGLAEYALILALIFLGNQVSTILSDVGNSV